jgi:WD40 repeat protein
MDAEYTRNSLRDNQEKSSNGEIINFVSPDDAQFQNQEDIHVYPFKSGHKVLSDSTSSIGSEYESGNEDYFDFKRATEPKKAHINSNQTTLEPDPILTIQKLIGFGPGSKLNCYTDCVKWSSDNQYLVYPAQAIVIAYHVNTSVQWCFVGHADKVTCLSLTFDGQLMASGQTGPHSLIRLWDFQSRKCLSIFRGHDHSLSLIEFSHCGNYLCGVGKDKQGKSMLVLWDVKDFKSNTKATPASPKVVAKAHTDVHIARILFVPYDSSRLITCGRDNIRFWRLKNDSLRSCAVNLSLYIQSLNMTSNPYRKENEKVFLDFTDICVNTRVEGTDNSVYACTRTGQIFVFNIARMEIEFVRVLEPLIKRKEILVNSSQRLEISPSLRLNSLTVSDKFCVTGSDDGFVRIWPLDFSQVSVEAEHESSIGVVRFSPDCFRICTATLNGNLGILDVNQKDYITLIRSHTDSILDFSFDSTCSFIATSSLDSTVR